MTRIGVITFPGTLGDRDATRAVRPTDGGPIALWHKNGELHGADAVIVLGGFSCDDYLRYSVITATVLVMREIIEQVGKGMPVLGICSGLQVLCEAYLLPGVLIHDGHRKSLCRDQALRIENSDTMRTKSFIQSDPITVLLKDGGDNSQVSPEGLERLEGEDRVVLHYMEDNPNGSAKDIVGVTNDTGNVVGLMPHSGHAVEPGFGPLSADTPGAHLGHRDTQGPGIFQPVLASLLR